MTCDNGGCSDPFASEAAIWAVGCLAAVAAGLGRHVSVCLTVATLLLAVPVVRLIVVVAT